MYPIFIRQQELYSSDCVHVECSLYCQQICIICVYQCNADLFIKTEALLSDNDLVIYNAITSPGFKLFSCPNSARESGGTLLLFIFFNSLIGYDSYNTSTMIQYTIKI